MKCKRVTGLFVIATVLTGMLASAAVAAPPEGLPPGDSAPAAGDSAPAPGGGGQENSSQKFTYQPYWDDSNLKTALGGELLFFSDVHDYEDDYFYYDSETGETKGVFSYLKKYDLHPGLYVSQGDYLQKSSDLTVDADAYYKCIDRIQAWEGGNAQIVSVMGNHENKTSAQDDLNGEQVFEKIVGNNNYGLIAKGVDEEDPEKVLYYVCAFGCSHSDEYDAAGTRANAKNKYWVNPDALQRLDQDLASIYGEDGSQNIGVPTYIDAHLPIHYYTSERWAENSADLLDVLNKYPYVVYVWGHTHSEKDPYYGTIKLPGDTIIPYADIDAVDVNGEPATEEIRFTYVSGGAVRGNQISDDPMEDSERALYVRGDGSRLFFEYCGRDGEIFDRNNYTDIINTTSFEDFATWSAASAAGAEIDLLKETDPGVVFRGDFFLNRPVIGEMPLPVKEYSDRYTARLTWTDSQGSEIEGTFAAGETYTAVLTLQPEEGIAFDLTGQDVYLFDYAGQTIPARYITGKEVQMEGDTAVIRITFLSTPQMNDQPLEAVEKMEPGNAFLIASDQEIYLSSRNKADCVCEDGKMLTVPDTSSDWKLEPAEGGYYLVNSNGTYLTKDMNGMNAVLTPVKDPSGADYCIWNQEDGGLSIKDDKSVYYLKYANGTFVLGTGQNDQTVKLYPAGSR